MKVEGPAPDPVMSRPGFAPLLDNPASHDPTQDHARVGLVVDALERLIRASLNKASDGRPSIGLLGGLGQGKTSALSQLTLRLADSKRNTSTYQSLAFDVAHYKPEQLEFEFDRLQASLRYGRVIFHWLRDGLARSVAASFGIVLVIVLVLWLWEVSLPQLNAKDAKVVAGIFLKGVPTLVALLFPAWLLKESGIFRNRSKERYFLMGDGQRRPSWLARAKTWWMQCFCPIHLLVIDNLDRASIAQQRALLRSLYKFKGELPYCVVVAFDETSLLQSGADPEAPRELLDKAIQIMVRLPDRMPFENLVLAHLALGGLSGTVFSAIAEQPRVKSGLADLLYLGGNASPRRAKRLLNDGLARLTQNHGLISDDRPDFSSESFETYRPRMDRLLAMLRVTALTELAPALRAQPQALTLGLTLCSPASMAPLQAIFAMAPTAESLLRASRLCRPSTGDWRDVVSMALAQSYQVGAEVALLTKETNKSKGGGVTGTAQADLYTLLQGLWNAIDVLAMTGSGDELDEHAREGSHEARRPWVVPVLSVYLLAQADGATRWRLLEWFRRALKSNVGERRRWFDDADTRIWLCEMAFSQLDVHEYLGTLERIRFWLDFANALQIGPRLALLVLYPPGYLSMRDVLCLMDARPAAVRALYDSAAMMQTIDVEVPDVRAWFNQLATTTSRGLGSAEQVEWPEPHNLSASVFSTFARAWPSLQAAESSVMLAQLADQLELFRWLHLNRPSIGFTVPMLTENTFDHGRLMLAVTRDIALQNQYRSALIHVWQGSGTAPYSAWQIGPSRDLLAGRPSFPLLKGLFDTSQSLKLGASAMLTLFAAMQSVATLGDFWEEHGLAQTLGRDESFLLLLYQCIEKPVEANAGLDWWQTLLGEATNRAILKNIFGHVLRDLEERLKLRTKIGLQLLAG